MHTHNEQPNRQRAFMPKSIGTLPSFDMDYKHSTTLIFLQFPNQRSIKYCTTLPPREQKQQIQKYDGNKKDIAVAYRRLSKPHPYHFHAKSQHDQPNCNSFYFSQLGTGKSRTYRK